MIQVDGYWVSFLISAPRPISPVQDTQLGEHNQDSHSTVLVGGVTGTAFMLHGGWVWKPHDTQGLLALRCSGHS